MQQRLVAGSVGERRDLRDMAREGVPLELTFAVARVSADACSAFEGAVVDIWHCDALGEYSGVSGPGQSDQGGSRWLRGYQVTDANGIATFTTIYPGWYPGRTTHIHFRVNRNATLSALSQLYFPDEINQRVYATAPYQARGNNDTSNQRDALLQASEGLPLSRVIPDGPGYLATLRIAIAERR